MISSRQHKDVIVYHAIDTQYGFRIAYLILNNVVGIIIGLFILAMGLSGCAKQPTPFRPPSSGIHFTPTAQTSPTPTFTPQPIESPLPTTTPVCTNNLTLLESVSIPDGTVVHPGVQLDKRWLVQNSGSCNWDEHYQLRSVAGMGINAPPELALYPARSGAKATIRIQFTAPSEQGSYQGTWQAYDPQEQPFGDLLNLLIMVNSGTP